MEDRQNYARIIQSLLGTHFRYNTVQDRGALEALNMEDRQNYARVIQSLHNRYTVRYLRNRYTIRQSTPHVLSAYRDHSMEKGGKKGDFFPHSSRYRI